MSSKNKKETLNKSLSNDELVNYMKDVAKEMAMAIKISQDGTFDDIIEQAFGTKKSDLQEEEAEVAMDSPKKDLNNSQSMRSKSNSPHRQSPFGRSPKKNSPPRIKKEQQKMKEIFNNFEKNSNANVNFDNFFQVREKKVQGPTNFYDKKVNERKKFEQRMEHLRKKKEQDENSKLTLTPHINDNSRIILEKKNEKIVPIQDRVQSVLINRNMKVDNMKRNLISNNESQLDVTSTTTATYNKEKFDKWVKGQHDHLMEKKQQIEEYKEILRQKEEIELKQMKQKFNNKSKILTKQNPDYEGPIHDKLYKDNSKTAEKKLALIEKYTPSFKPQLMAKQPKFPRTSSQQNIKDNKNSTMIVTEIDPIPDRTNTIVHGAVSQRNMSPDKEDDETVLIARYKIALQRQQNNKNESESMLKMIKAKAKQPLKQRSSSVGMENGPAREEIKKGSIFSQPDEEPKRGNVIVASGNRKSSAMQDNSSLFDEDSNLYSGRFGKDKTTSGNDSSILKKKLDNVSLSSKGTIEKNARVSSVGKSALKQPKNQSESESYSRISQELEMANKRVEFDDLGSESLYKLNVRQNSAWNQHIENKVVYKGGAKEKKEVRGSLKGR